MLDGAYVDGAEDKESGDVGGTTLDDGPGDDAVGGTGASTDGTPGVVTAAVAARKGLTTVAGVVGGVGGAGLVPTGTDVAAVTAVAGSKCGSVGAGTVAEVAGTKVAGTEVVVLGAGAEVEAAGTVVVRAGRDATVVGAGTDVEAAVAVVVVTEPLPVVAGTRGTDVGTVTDTTFA